MTKLAAKTDVAPRTIYSVRDDEGYIPRPDTAYKLALGCGATDEEATAIAAGCSSEKAKLRTA